MESTLKESMRMLSAAPKLLEAAHAAWNCISELPPTQARVEVAQMLQRDRICRGRRTGHAAADL